MSTVAKPGNVWKLAEAKNKLSEVVNRTISEGRQEIHRRDDVVVVISKEELEKLEKLEGSSPRKSVKEVLLSNPETPYGEPSLTDIILEGRRWFKDHDE